MAGKRPQYRAIKFHDDDNPKNATEVGAAWPLKEKDGFSIELKRGLTVAGRIVLLPNTQRDDSSDDGI